MPVSCLLGIAEDKEVTSTTGTSLQHIMGTVTCKEINDSIWLMKEGGFRNQKVQNYSSGEIVLLLLLGNIYV